MFDAVENKPKTLAQHQLETRAIIEKKIAQAPHMNPHMLADDAVDALSNTLARLLKWRDMLVAIALPQNVPMLAAPQQACIEHEPVD
jgi:hypothetical protein